MAGENQSVIIEIRAGAGGDEAGLFAGDLFRMYSRYAAIKGWHQNVLDSKPSEAGGFKEVVFELKGGDAYAEMQYEGGVHRVQRIPATERQGRVHTSTASIAVLLKPKEFQLNINPKDLRVEVCKASGPGGQNVNKRMTAVRITHLPTKITVAAQSERSHAQNKEQAMKLLYAKLYQLKEREKAKTLAELKGKAVSIEWGNQIRSYVLHPYKMVKDLRTNVETSNTEEILDGNLDQFIEAELKLS